MYEIWKVGRSGLIGEVIRTEGDRAAIQVHVEATTQAIYVLYSDS